MATTALLEQLKTDMLKADTTARLASSRDISEKIDTSTWNDKDLIVFDSLIAERRNAEKDHHKFSIDYRKRKVTSRDLKAPNDWKYDNETAGYRYVGQANLCPMVSCLQLSSGLLFGKDIAACRISLSTNYRLRT